MTIVVISCDRREELLDSLLRHEAPVIFVDNGSGDGSSDAVRMALPDVTVIPLPRNAGAKARNLGVQRASTPYVAFADDDSWWEPGALARAADILDAHPRLALLAGQVLVGPQRKPDMVSQAMERAPLGTTPGAPGPNVLGFMACGAIVRRSAFLEAGGFDDIVHFPGEEERLSVDLATAGWWQCYVPEVTAVHMPSPARSSARRRAHLISRNAVLTAVMRRPWAEILRRAGAGIRAGGGSRSGVVAAVPRLHRAVRARRQVPAEIERQLRLLASTS